MSAKLDATNAEIKCPKCGSTALWCDGTRLIYGEQVQRYRCRTCGFRFSERKLKAIFREDKRVSVGLSPVEECIMPFPVMNQTGDISTLQQIQSSKGKIVEYALWMQKQGYAETTITRRIRLFETMVKRGVNLLDAESVKEGISKQKTWGLKTRVLAVDGYTNFLKMLGQTWMPPHYKPVRKLPIIPLEREIDELIAGCNPRTATFLRLLKETGARLGEAWQLEWFDFDFETKTVNITPEKGSNPRKLKISDKLISMLNNLPKDKTKVFQGSLRHFARGFRRQRKRIAFKLKNDKIAKISCHTFRHWKATTEIAKHRTLKEVQYMLGHKSLLSTDYYVQLVTFESDDYISATAKTIQEAQKLVEAGFDWVCNFDDAKLFRKRK